MKKIVKYNIKEFVTHYLTKDKNIQSKQVMIKNEQEINIKCTNEESVEAAEKILQRKLSSICKIEKEQLLKPKLRIVGIDNTSKMDIKNIEQDINSRNFKIVY